MFDLKLLIVLATIGCFGSLSAALVGIYRLKSMNVYEVTLTKTIGVRVEANSAEEAQEIAIERDNASEYDLDWDVEADATDVTNLEDLLY